MNYQELMDTVNKLNAAGLDIINQTVIVRTGHGVRVSPIEGYDIRDGELVLRVTPPKRLERRRAKPSRAKGQSDEG